MAGFTPHVTHLDVRGFLCPIPALKAEEAIQPLPPGAHLEILGDDPVMVIDIPAWCDDKGHRLISCEKRAGLIRCVVMR
jgi:tRNA 2-thiouridine synthesizing protein A